MTFAAHDNNGHLYQRGYAGEEGGLRQRCSYYKHTNTHTQAQKQKEIPQIVSALKAPVRVNQVEWEQHMYPGKREETRETQTKEAQG